MKLFKLFTLLFVLLFVESTFGAKVDIKNAENAAINWKKSISINKKNAATIARSNTSTFKGVDTYYIFNFQGGGFVIVAADDNISPILGYSDENVFPENITNETVKWWLGEYEKQIAFVINNKLENAESKKEWTNVINNTFNEKGSKAIGPLLTTTWDQGCYYNTKCPVDNAAPNGFCSHVPTGCVATAMAQIMKYNNYPAKGSGKHTDTDKTYGTLTADFANTTYNWGNMTTPKVTAENADVATLMSHCGIAVNMMYAADGSGAYVDDAAYALKTYFGYTNAKYIERSSYSSDAAWEAVIKADLDQLFPVFYSGIDVNVSSGHAFVCDGYNSTGKYHINWGWSGQANGYFLLTSLVPTGTSYNFSSSMMAIVNIEPPTVAPVAAFAANILSIPAGNSVNFTDNSSYTPTSWQWVFAGAVPSSSTVKNPQNITYSTTGTYAVTLTAKNDYGTNTKTIANYINVYTPGSIALTVSLGNDTTICTGNSIVITAKAAGGTAPYTYKWNNNSTAQTITVTPSVSSTYTVTVIDSKYKTATDSKVVSSGAAPRISQQPLSQTLCAGNTASFSVVASGSYLSYNWQYSADLGSSFNSISTAFSATYSFVANSLQNNYKYKCVVNSSCNQPVSSNTVTLTVNSPVVISVQPYSINTCGVKPAQFTILASGNNNSYQWYENGNKLSNTGVYSNSNTSTLKISNVTGLDSKKYSCVIAGGCSSAVTSSTAYLSVTSVCNQCDTLNYPLVGTQYIYPTDGGYATGTNSYGITNFAQFFPTYPANKVITAVRIAFDHPYGNDNDMTVITIKDNKGSGGSPGTTIATANVSIGTIKQYISNHKYTLINFSSPVTVTTPFFVCVKIPSIAGDTVAIISNLFGDVPAGGNAWVLYGSWGKISDVYQYTPNIDLAISPILCDKCEALSAVVNASGSTSFCEGGSVKLTANTGNFTYQWKKDGKIITGATTSLLNVNSTGAFALEIKDNGGCIAASVPLDITVFPKPVVNLGSDKTITTIQTITLDAGAGFASYIWSNQAQSQKIEVNGAIKGPGDYKYSVYVKDANGCPGKDTVNIKIVTMLCKLIGKVTYVNAAKTPLTNIKLYLYKVEGENPVDSATTDASGNYSISNIVSGNYFIKSKTAKLWGGGDPTDGLLINKNFVKLYNITDPLLKEAADVSDEKAITPTDALLINKRFVKIINTFKKANWVFDIDTITIQNEVQTYNYRAVCAGDINGSYTPAKKMMNNISIIDKGEVRFNKGEIFDMPIYLNNNIELGALGLKFKVQSSQFKVIDVVSGLDGLIFNIADNEVNIAWSAYDKMYANDTEKPLFILKAIANNSIDKSLTHIFELEQGSVIADYEGNLIKDAELIEPFIFTNDILTAYDFRVFPNPFSNTTNIRYELSVDSKVKITLYDILGKELEIITDEQQKPGAYTLEFNASNYSQGVYYCKFEIDNTYSQLYKLIISK